jgi:hypothetical protein
MAGSDYGGAGGGGAGVAGSSPTGSNYAVGGKGGDGIQSSITGVATYYGGGGSGSTHNTQSTNPGGGLGGGGCGKYSTNQATPGTDGLGGGGGGGGETSYPGKNGGSGVVIIRYISPFIIPDWLSSTTGGTLYVIDPIPVTAKFSASTNNPTLFPPEADVTAKFSASAPITLYQCIIASTVKFAAKVVGKIFVNLASLKLQEITVSRNVQDKIWNCTATLDQFYNLDLTALRNIIYATTDHLGASHCIFSGIVPQTAPEIGESKDRTVLTAQDYGWFLANQMVPAAYQHNTAGTNPATVIAGFLGGDDWETTTGIEPYNINSVTAWGSTLASRVFDFDSQTTKMAAIQKICDYCRFMFIVKWRLVSGSYYRPTGYFIDENDIDTELDLPAAVTITAPDSYLKEKITIVSKVTERYNRITVIGRDPSGTVYSAILSSPGLTSGDELPVEFIENSGAWTTQAQVDARCLELYNFYINPSTVWTATFLDRTDLQLLQKIKFMGYTSQGVTEDWMRITSIRYTIGKGAEKTVVIEFTTDQAYSNITRMYRSNSPDSVIETETIFDGKMAQVPQNEVGTVTAIDGNTATITLEDGRVVTARIL